MHTGGFVNCALRCSALLLFALLAACGKYGPPLPPESFSPRAVKQLQVTADTGGVRFKWESPDADLRGAELRNMDGYYVMRKALEHSEDATDADVPFEEIGRVSDTHVLEREKKRDGARAAGRPARRIDSDAALKKFEYTDSSAAAGKAYLYKVVPHNQGGVEGRVAQLVRVVFKGAASQISYIDESSFDEELLVE